MATNEAKTFIIRFDKIYCPVCQHKVKNMRSFSTTTGNTKPVTTGVYQCEKCKSVWEIKLWKGESR